MASGASVVAHQGTAPYFTTASGSALVLVIDESSKYGGHDLLHLRGNYLFDERTEVFASLNNLLDKRYAETSGLDNSGPTYNPGLPRNLTVGVQLRW